MFANLPIWALVLVVFACRVVDVSIGTVRTIAVVNGRVVLSVVLGFFELLIWISAAGPVIVRLKESPLLIIAFAGGFATGNAVGILLERKMALGDRVLRMVSMERGPAIAVALREAGFTVTTFEGMGRDGPRTLLYISCPRRAIAQVLEIARAHDPRVFYVVEAVAETRGIPAGPAPTGWRAIAKKK